MNIQEFMSDKEKYFTIADRKVMEEKLVQNENFFLEKSLIPILLDMGGQEAHYLQFLIDLSNAINEYLDGKTPITRISTWSLLPQILWAMTTNEEDLCTFIDMLSFTSQD
ncbi:MAG: hypothetical protein WCQ49_01600 [Candidatus Saccharibacteria bacterium]